MFSRVLVVAGGLWLGRIEVSGESIQRIERLRIAIDAEVAHAGENAQRFRQRDSKIAQPDGDFASEDGAGGGAEDADILRLVRFQKLAVDSNCVVERRREWVLRGEAVEHGDDLRLREEGYGNRLGK